MERLSLTIEGMSCGHCVRGVERALQGVSGVEVERVEIGSALVSFDPASVKPAQIEAAIVDEGYEVRSMEPAT